MLPICRTCIPFRAQGGGKLCTSTLYRLWFLKVILKKWAKYICSCQKNVDINWLLLFPFSHSFSLSERLVAVLAPYFTFNGTNHTMPITLTHESHSQWISLHNFHTLSSKKVTRIRGIAEILQRGFKLPVCHFQGDNMTVMLISTLCFS